MNHIGNIFRPEHYYEWIRVLNILQQQLVASFAQGPQIPHAYSFGAYCDYTKYYDCPNWDHCLIKCERMLGQVG